MSATKRTTKNKQIYRIKNLLLSDTPSNWFIFIQKNNTHLYLLHNDHLILLYLHYGYEYQNIAFQPLDPFNLYRRWWILSIDRRILTWKILPNSKTTKSINQLNCKKKIWSTHNKRQNNSTNKWSNLNSPESFSFFFSFEVHLSLTVRKLCRSSFLNW